MYAILESAMIAAFDSRNRDVRESHPHMLAEDWNAKRDMTLDGFPISGDHLHLYRGETFIIDEKKDRMIQLPETLRK